MTVLKALGLWKARRLLSIVAAIVFALSATTVVPAQARVAAPADHHAGSASTEQHALDHTTGHAAAHKSTHCDDDGGKAGPHGGSCCQMSCHAALPAQAVPAARVHVTSPKVIAAAAPLGQQRILSIDRPPRFPA
jgi:hypothetical protein